MAEEQTSEYAPTSDLPEIILPTDHPRTRSSRRVQQVLPAPEEEEVESSELRQYLQRRSYDDARNEITQAKAEGMLSLSEVMAKRSTKYENDQNEREAFVADMMEVLYTFDEEVMTHHIQGDLVSKYMTDESFKAKLDSISARANTLFEAKKQPCIYRNTVTDPEGRGLKASDLREVLNAMRQYTNCENEALMHSVDHQIPWPGDRGTKGRYVVVGEDFPKSRAEAITAFVDNVKARLENCGDEDRLQPFFTVGYTNDPANRAKQHKAHSGSNYIINLYEAVCMHLNLDQRLQNHVICLCWRAGHAEVAEIVAEELGCCQVATGAGFRYHPSGGSNISANAYSWRAWQLYEMYAEEHTSYTERFNADLNSSESGPVIQDVARMLDAMEHVRDATQM